MSNHSSLISVNKLVNTSQIDTEVNFSDISQFDPQVCGNLTQSYLKVNVITKQNHELPFSLVWILS